MNSQARSILVQTPSTVVHALNSCRPAQAHVLGGAVRLLLFLQTFKEKIKLSNATFRSQIGEVDGEIWLI